MLIVSHHVLLTTDIKLPAHTILRVNIAWLRDKESLIRILEDFKNDIYLDYPQGRNKPPRPTISLDDAIELAKCFDNVKYFAISNVENPDDVYKIAEKLPDNIEIIPKIETKKGIENLEIIVEKNNIKHIMLDKEDLYIDVDKDHDIFKSLLNLIREKGEKIGVKILEVQGVVFAVPDDHKRLYPNT